MITFLKNNNFSYSRETITVIPVFACDRCCHRPPDAHNSTAPTYKCSAFSVEITPHFNSHYALLYDYDHHDFDSKAKRVAFFTWHIFCHLWWMNHPGVAPSQTPALLHVLLADDDYDDRYFFDRMLQAFHTPPALTTVADGEELMTYLNKNSEKLPDVLFLDLNMPRKNGLECLTEIKSNRKLKLLPVIVYSTSPYEVIADQLYDTGAHYYVRKTDITELQKVLHLILTLLAKNKFVRPKREQFILDLSTAH